MMGRDRKGKKKKERDGGGVVFKKKKRAYEMEARDWSTDVCSSDLVSPPLSNNSLLTSSKNTQTLPDIALHSRYGRKMCCNLDRKSVV